MMEKPMENYPNGFLDGKNQWGSTCFFLVRKKQLDMGKNIYVCLRWEKNPMVWE